jgi:hypothetical protein
MVRNGRPVEAREILDVQVMHCMPQVPRGLTFYSRKRDDPDSLLKQGLRNLPRVLRPSPRQSHLSRAARGGQIRQKGNNPGSTVSNVPRGNFNHPAGDCFVADFLQ